VTVVHLLRCIRLHKLTSSAAAAAATQQQHHQPHQLFSFSSYSTLAHQATTESKGLAVASVVSSANWIVAVMHCRGSFPVKNVEE